MTLQEVKEKYTNQLHEMVRDERKAVEEQHERQRRSGSRKITYDAAYNIAHERVCKWVEDAQEEAVDLSNLVELAGYVAGHRQAKIWATIIGKA